MLKKDIIYKGLNLTWFYKITGVNIIETWKDVDWKLYSAICSINSYTSETKEFDLEQITIELKNLRETWLNFWNYYSEIKLTDDFLLSVDC